MGETQTAHEKKKIKETHHRLLLESLKGKDALGALRAEKRALGFKEFDLKALRDCEKTQAKTEAIAMERRKKLMAREKLMEEERIRCLGHR